jgi:hypothetical protein
MRSSDITLTVIIIIVFVLLMVFNMLAVGIKQIKDDWPTYRCNPSIMPFASVFGHDTGENFTYCIQTMQTNYMGHLMQPLTYNLDSVGDIGGQLSKAVNDIRAFFSKIRSFTTDIVQSIFGVFLNILIEFQRLMVNIKDLFSKLVGILVTILYMVSGFMMLGESSYKGPPGALVKALCFHPDTQIRLADNSLVSMKDLPLNAKLKTGTRVCAVMNISNIDEDGNQIETVYRVVDGENNEDILVSGSHLVFDPEVDGFVYVKDLRGDKPSIPTAQKCAQFCCLITSDHTIPIGKWIFHDWEDNNGSPSKSFV